MGGTTVLLITLWPLYSLENRSLDRPKSDRCLLYGENDLTNLKRKGSQSQ